MSPTNDQIERATEEMVTSGREKGDTYDEDTGEFLGSLDLPNGIPAAMSVYIDGWWYIFKPDSRYRDVPIDPPPDVPTTSTSTLTATELLQLAEEVNREMPPSIDAEDSIFPKKGSS